MRVKTEEGKPALGIKIVLTALRAVAGGIVAVHLLRY